MIKGTVIACKDSSFADKKNVGQVVSGYTVSVALEGNNGWIEVWSKNSRAPGDTVELTITEGKYHKAKVKIV